MHQSLGTMTINPKMDFKLDAWSLMIWDWDFKLSRVRKEGSKGNIVVCSWRAGTEVVISPYEGMETCTTNWKWEYTFNFSFWWNEDNLRSFLISFKMRDMCIPCIWRALYSNSMIHYPITKWQFWQQFMRMRNLIYTDLPS